MPAGAQIRDASLPLVWIDYGRTTRLVLDEAERDQRHQADE